MRSIAVSGSPGKDVQIKIDSVEKLPSPFRKFLRKTVAYSQIPQLYGPEWNMEKVFRTLRKRSVQPIYYSYGGRAPHVAYGIAKLGGNVRLLTVFGDDLDEPYEGFFNGGYWSHLLRAGVKMELLKLSVPDTVWRNPESMKDYLKEKYTLNIYRADALQVAGKETSTIVCCKDLAGIDFFYIDDVKGAGYIEVARPAPREIIDNVDIVFVTTSERPFMEDMALTASRMGKELMIDVGSYGVTPSYLLKTIPLAKIIFGNSSEIKQVCEAFEVETIEGIFSVTRTKFPEAIILEDKFNGSVQIYTQEGDNIKIGPIPLNKTGNSVGCCDGIAAGFLSLYQRGFDLETCVKAGLVLCASIWEVEGVQEGMPSKSEFYERFTKYFGSQSSKDELERVRQALGI